MRPGLRVPIVAVTSRFWGTDMTDQQTNQPDVAAVDGYAEMQVDTLLNLAEPQPMYRDMIEQGGMASPMDGIVMVFSRELNDFVLRHHELFSSHIDMHARQRASADPAERRSAEALEVPQAPRPAVRAASAWTSRRTTSRVASTSFIDAFIDRGECNFTEEFAELFPSSVFLGLMGLPEDELRMFLRPARRHPAPGEDRPERARRRRRARRGAWTPTGQEIYDYFGNLVDERTAAAGRRHHHPLPRRPRSTASSSPAKTSSTSASCSSSPASTR